MLYVYYGTDVKKVADQTNKLIANLLKKRPDAQVFSFENKDVDESKLDELIEAQGLFVEKHIVVLKQTFEMADSRDVIIKRLKHFASAPNVFIIAENKLVAEHKKKLKKYASDIKEHNEIKKETNKFNVFSLGDALGARNRQLLWKGYIDALRAGLEVESIHGTLHWAVKSMLSAQNSNSPDEAGQKSFTYNKFKRYSANFKDGELKKLSRELISIYHDARRGKHELKTALERWCLGV